MILQGDALSVLKTLPNEHVDMTITSPPYYFLRDYGIEGQLGLEPTYNEYITKLCDVFDEVKRVLKPQGTCWVNLADSYSGSSGGHPSPFHSKAQRFNYTFPKPPRTDIPKKSLCLIPFRFAIEMVKRGWILRNTLIWRKGNSLPESVKDRFTVDFEYLFFFAKSPRYYFKQQFEPSAQPLTTRNRPDKRNHRSILEVNTKALFSNHFAAYPEQLIEMPIRAGSPENGIVLDVFLGSGTTGLVAERLNRRWIGIELNPDYIRLATERLAAQAQ